MRWCSRLAALVAISTPVFARAAVVVDGALGGGGGSDSALFRLATTIPSDATISDHFVDLRPELSVTWLGEPGTRVTLACGGVVRQFASAANGRAFGSLATLSGGTDLAGPFGVAGHLSGTLEHFDRVEADYSSLGAAAGPRLRLGALELAVLGELQTLDSKALSTTAVGGAATLGWRTRPADLAARVRWQTDRARWSQGSAEVAASTQAGAWTGSLQLAAGRATSGTWAEAEATIGLHVSGPWTVEVRGRGSREWDAAAMPDAWAANGLLLVRYTIASGGAALQELLAEVPPPERRAAPPREGVRVVVRVPEGTRTVAIVGELDGWSQRGVALTRVGPGLFEGVLTPKPGRYEYRVRLGNGLVVPEGAGAYADDGFGGRNAVMIVRQDGRGVVELIVP